MNEPVRILQFMSEANFGGTERSVYSLITSMDPKRFSNDVCFLLARGPMGDEFAVRGFHVSYLHWSLWRAPWALFKLYRLLLHGRYEIVHAYGLRANLLARLIGRFTRVPQIIGGLRSQYPSSRKNSFLVWLDRVTLPLARYYVANAQASVDYLVSQGYAREKFRVIHNGIESASRTLTDDDRCALRARYGFPAGDISLIVYVARFRPGKGQQDLLVALTLLSTGKYLCLLVGDGPERPSVEDLAHKLGLGEYVRFMGARDHEEVCEILRLADIFVLASQWEGMPMAVLEAMAAGLPVVATDVGGTRELVVEGETGFLISPGDAQGLADRVARLLGDPELRQHLALAVESVSLNNSPWRKQCENMRRFIRS